VGGRQEKDIDFLAEKEGVMFAVEVENWIRYEANTRNEVFSKVGVAR
jgi:hypothetical protein